MGSRIKLKDRLIKICSELIQEIPCDFVGVATYNPSGRELYWEYAVGNRNEKYKLITVRYGKGIAGQVIRTGVPMTINSFPQNILGKATEYPIMLAEKLISAMAVPVYYNNTPWGVLLSGNRQQTIFSPDQLKKVQNRAYTISECISQELYGNESSINSG